jgi:HSP20 family molecular chaperone IbpA
MANSLRIPLVLLFLAWVALASARVHVHAHGDRWGSCGRTKSAGDGRGGNHDLQGGRHYNYHRRPRDTMDLVSQIFSSPLYYNSLIRQQDAQSARIMDERSDGVSSSAPFYAITESEDGQALDLEIEVPGVSAKEINVETENDRMLRVQGSRRLHENGSVTQMRFDKVFQIDTDADIENIHVTLSSGILLISVPKKPKKARIAKSIPIAIQEDKETEVNKEVTIEEAEWVAVVEEDNENEIGSEDENEKLQIQQDDDFTITEDEDSWQ